MTYNSIFCGLCQGRLSRPRRHEMCPPDGGTASARGSAITMLLSDDAVMRDQAQARTA